MWIRQNKGKRTKMENKIEIPEFDSGSSKGFYHDFGEGKVVAYNHGNPDGTVGGIVAASVDLWPSTFVNKDVEIHGSGVFDLENRKFKGKGKVKMTGDNTFELEDGVIYD